MAEVGTLEAPVMAGASDMVGLSTELVAMTAVIMVGAKALARVAANVVRAPWARLKVSPASSVVPPKWGSEMRPPGIRQSEKSLGQRFSMP